MCIRILHGSRNVVIPAYVVCLNDEVTHWAADMGFPYYIIMYHVISKMDNREFDLAIHESRTQSQGDNEHGLVDAEGEDPSEIILVSTVE